MTTRAKRHRCVAALVPLALLACVQPLGDVGSGGLTLRIDVDPAALAALDAGRVRVLGPTPRDTTVSPGAAVRISGLAPGTYTLALEGLVAGAVANYVQIGPVQVLVGQTTTASVPSFPSFVVPNVTVPASTGTRTFTVNYTRVTYAQSYRVEAATNTAFTQNVVPVTRPGSDSSAVVTVTTDGTYYVRVRGVDPHGVDGQWAAAQQITVNCSGSATFSYTGGSQTFAVPACVTSITIDAYGAAGGTGAGAGGRGGRALGTRAVTGGSTLTVMVGGAGLDVGSTGNANGFAGGFNGGGRVREYITWSGQSEGLSGTGGGASDVRIGGTALSNRIIVAGGGGGGGNTAAGHGGGATGGAGITGAGNTVGGGGGTQTAGGTAGNCCANYPNQPGSLGVGGDAYRDGAGSGGGGGGWYGGGGGQFAGGGGGSSYLGGVTGGSTTPSVRAGNGQVIITW